MSGGIKYDAGKAPISLIPVEAIIAEAQVFAFGAQKYEKHNFRKGMDWTRPLDAAMRHLLAFTNGEDLDPESGISHLAHARCNLAMVEYYRLHGLGNDDRYKGLIHAAGRKVIEAHRELLNELAEIEIYKMPTSEPINEWARAWAVNKAKALLEEGFKEESLISEYCFEQEEIDAAKAEIQRGKK